MRHLLVCVLSCLLSLCAIAQELAPEAPEIPTVLAIEDTEIERLTAERDRVKQMGDEAGATVDRYRELKGDIDLALASTRERLALGRASDSFGLILLTERRKLAPVLALATEFKQLQAEIANLKLAQIDLRDARRNLAKPQARAVALLTAAGPELDTPELRREMQRRLERQLALSKELERLNGGVITKLEASESALSELLSVAQTFAELLDQRLLWVPSLSPVDVAWFSALPTASLALFQQPAWSELWKAPMRAWKRQSLQSSLLMLAPLMLLVVRRRLLRIADDHARVAKSFRRHRYRHTLQAGLIALVLASPLPVALAALAKLMSIAESRMTGLQAALYAAAAVLLLGLFMRMLAREGGPGERYFDWSAARRSWFMREAPWLAGWLALLSCAAGAAQALLDPRLGTDVLLRSLLLLACLGLSIAAFTAYRGYREVLTERFFSRMLRRATLLMAPALALLTLAGFSFTSLQIGSYLVRSVWVGLGAMLLHDYIAHWLVMAERRLARQRYLQQREADAERSTDAEGISVAPEPEITLESVGQQTRNLLRALYWTVLGTGLLWVWSDVAPALNLLDEIVLWQLAGEEGAAPYIVSLRDLLFAVLLAVGATIAANNLPGLVEMIVLRRIEMDAATRYAITSLSRYVIVAVGVIGVAALIGLRWSQLQWLIAALGVGLGFGLQEIFANFISGLILLFEKPIRVGDTITIGEFSGTVARIRTRATTITDWDNKEIIVPNKAFITERLINWSLSDTHTRVVIRVGVGYASNPTEVRRLLIECAKSHPLTLAEPPPQAVFMAFGASSLDFELRVFVRSIGDRLHITNDLNTRVLEALRAADIEIPFPQVDLHVRRLADALREARGPDTSNALKS